MIVGLTGGIGSGKSTVAQFFSELGVPIYDSDEEAKRLMMDSQEVRDAIVEPFGPEAYRGKKLNKTFIAKIVFNEKRMLDQLNAIVHPAVRHHFLNWVSQQDFPYVIQETALIFENNAEDNYDRIILVTAPEDLKIQRVVERDGVNRAQVIARMSNQFPDGEKVGSSDYVIENSELPLTKKTVGKIHNELLGKALKKPIL